MNLLVIRHAIAEDKEVFAATGRSDDRRPLTKEGRSKMRRAAEGLRVACPRVGVLASSPLVRARETAEIVAPIFRIANVEIVEALRPDRPFEELTQWLRQRLTPTDGDATVAVVGHEPHLSGLVTWLMTGGTESRVELKKGWSVPAAFRARAESWGGDPPVGPHPVTATRIVEFLTVGSGRAIRSVVRPSRPADGPA